MARHRVLKIAMIVVGGLIVLVAGLLVTLRLTSPSSDLLSPVVEKPIPEAWLEPPSSAYAGEGDTPLTSNPEAPSEASISARRETFQSSGSLAFIGDGRPFGDETYTLEVSDQGVALESSGQFQFKVVVATIRISFSQSLRGDAALRPTDYRLRIDAPLGFGREISGSIRDGTADFTQGTERSSLPVDADRLFITGMFSTYALIPVLFEERQVGGEARFDLLAFGGPPGSSGDNQGTTEVLTVTRKGEALLLADELRLTVDRYLLETPYGESTLLSKGRDFLGFVAGNGEKSMIVYRSDYFPNGFELLEESASTAR
jgi:hypothetical protein